MVECGTQGLLVRVSALKSCLLGILPSRTREGGGGGHPDLFKKGGYS